MRFLSSIHPKSARILLRLDLDLPLENNTFDTTRLDDSLPTISYLWNDRAQHVTVLAHRGHTVTPTPEFSLQPIADLLYTKLLQEPSFAGKTEAELHSWLQVHENLRFDSREEQLNMAFAHELAKDQDLFVNDAFATAHREHTSIVEIPKILPTFFGLHFETEYAALQKITQHPERPFVFVLGGAKLETKMPLLQKMTEMADTILLGGKLAAEAQAEHFTHPKVHIATLLPDGLDIDEASIQSFSQEIAAAKTIVWNGPLGKFEDPDHMNGTAKIAQAIAQSQAYTYVGGGDTEAALTALGMDGARAFRHVSTAGGAMLSYLADGHLAAIDAAEEYSELSAESGESL